MKFIMDGEVFNVVTQKRDPYNIFDYTVIIGDKRVASYMGIFGRKNAFVYIYGNFSSLFYKDPPFIESVVNKILDDFDTLQEVSE